MARKAAKRKSAKVKARTGAKTAVKRSAKKTAKKTVKVVARKAAAKAKRKSAARRRSRKVAGTYETAISALTHYIEAGGKNLSAAGRSTLEGARDVIHEIATKVSKATAS
jgi:hypothetical protein